MSKLGDRLLTAGAPVLKILVENAVGGIGGKLAGVAIDALADAFKSPPTEEAIIARMDADPVGSAEIVQQVEARASDELARIAEANRDAMVSYHQILRDDAKEGGILARLWRPLLGMVYAPMVVMQFVTACWLMWTRQLGTLTQLNDLVGYLTFLNVAVCAVLGVTIWQAGKTDRETQR